MFLLSIHFLVDYLFLSCTIFASVCSMGVVSSNSLPSADHSYLFWLHSHALVNHSHFSHLFPVCILMFCSIISHLTHLVHIVYILCSPCSSVPDCASVYSVFPVFTPVSLSLACVLTTVFCLPSLLC
uniref:Uncharacterized protein n=1 Tax=Anguilla anguilla TaxID=7936 RepID=A0A0E9WZ19_ANGAN